MPNWCMNTLDITGPRERINNLAEAFAKGELLEFIRPVPAPLMNNDTSSFGGIDAEAKDELRARLRDEYGYTGWYEWRLANWGTKWDVGGPEAYCQVTELPNGLAHMSAEFESAWTPPLEVYEWLVAERLQVKAYYFEPGCGFAGRYEDGVDDYHEIFNREGAVQLPHDIVEMFDVMAAYEEVE
jgi:hypothetical protein